MLRSVSMGILPMCLFIMLNCSFLFGQVVVVPEDIQTLPVPEVPSTYSLVSQPGNSATVTGSVANLGDLAGILKVEVSGTKFNKFAIGCDITDVTTRLITMQLIVNNLFTALPSKVKIYYDSTTGASFSLVKPKKAVLTKVSPVSVDQSNGAVSVATDSSTPQTLSIQMEFPASTTVSKLYVEILPDSDDFTNNNMDLAINQIRILSNLIAIGDIFERTGGAYIASQVLGASVPTDALFYVNDGTFANGIRLPDKAGIGSTGPCKKHKLTFVAAKAPSIDIFSGFKLVIHFAAGASLKKFQLLLKIDSEDEVALAPTHAFDADNNALTIDGLFIKNVGNTASGKYTLVFDKPLTTTFEGVRLESFAECDFTTPGSEIAFFGLAKTAPPVITEIEIIGIEGWPVQLILPELPGDLTNKVYSNYAIYFIANGASPAQMATLLGKQITLFHGTASPPTTAVTCTGNRLHSPNKYKFVCNDVDLSNVVGPTLVYFKVVYDGSFIGFKTATKESNKLLRRDVQLSIQPLDAIINVIVPIVVKFTDSILPTGFVKFEDNGVVIPTCVAVPVAFNVAICLQWKPLLPTQTLKATYFGNVRYISKQVVKTINAKKVGISFMPTILKVGSNAKIKISVVGNTPSPTGKVQIAVAGSSSLGLREVQYPTGVVHDFANTLEITIQESNPLLAGTVVVTCTYLGDANYASNTKSATVQIKAVPTVVVTASPSPHSTVNQDILVRAILQSSSGDATGNIAVSFGNAAASCTISLPNEHCILDSTPFVVDATPKQISASFAGDAKNKAAQGSSPARMILKALPTMRVASFSPVQTVLPYSGSPIVIFTLEITGKAPKGNAHIQIGQDFESCVLPNSDANVKIVECSVTLRRRAVGSFPIQAKYTDIQAGSNQNIALHSVGLFYEVLPVVLVVSEIKVASISTPLIFRKDETVVLEVTTADSTVPKGDITFAGVKCNQRTENSKLLGICAVKETVRFGRIEAAAAFVPKSAYTPSTASVVYFVKTPVDIVAVATPTKGKANELVSVTVTLTPQLAGSVKAIFPVPQGVVMVSNAQAESSCDVQVTSSGSCSLLTSKIGGINNLVARFIESDEYLANSVTVEFVATEDPIINVVVQGDVVNEPLKIIITVVKGSDTKKRQISSDPAITVSVGTEEICRTTLSNIEGFDCIFTPSFAGKLALIVYFSGNDELSEFYFIHNVKVKSTTTLSLDGPTNYSPKESIVISSVVKGLMDIFEMTATLIVPTKEGGTPTTNTGKIEVVQPVFVPGPAKAPAPFSVGVGGSGSAPTTFFNNAPGGEKPINAQFSGITKKPTEDAAIGGTNGGTEVILKSKQLTAKPTGIIELAGIPCGPISLSVGAIACSALSSGRYTVTAKYLGDEHYDAAVATTELLVCSTGCKRCTNVGLQIGTCKQCDETLGYRLDVAGANCVPTCGTGEIMSGTPNKCNCKKYWAVSAQSGVCELKCPTGFYIAGDTCKPCAESCSRCNSFGSTFPDSCTECNHNNGFLFSAIEAKCVAKCEEGYVKNFNVLPPRCDLETTTTSTEEAVVTATTLSESNSVCTTKCADGTCVKSVTACSAESAVKSFQQLIIGAKIIEVYNDNNDIIALVSFKDELPKGSFIKVNPNSNVVLPPNYTSLSNAISLQLGLQDFVIRGSTTFAGGVEIAFILEISNSNDLSNLVLGSAPGESNVLAIEDVVLNIVPHETKAGFFVCTAIVTHFSSFAVLLSGSDNEDGSGGNSSDANNGFDTTLSWISLAFIIAAFVFVILAILIMNYVSPIRNAFLGDEGKRINKLRKSSGTGSSRNDRNNDNDSFSAV